MSATLSGTSVVVASQELVSSDLAGEQVILDLSSGMYYGLNPVGTRIWQLIQEPKTVKEVEETLLSEYEVEAEQCQKDLMTILEQLDEQGLIEVKNAEVA
ncbi:lasso peptide biosynthesis PqqD family chaperone [Merismopedia glauca]|uniref:PqqD family protein n=1 Tax=Merismopedia glauca CCAP 1448/3 TaxID=1296344 RepID=A0A2T1C207_9CYAN|nr:lasso peptide biosynthesis PqqD family chaperone [Merismopedia glauca]PSB02272.1 PqqD family protein [Merismopedia glauca CCAP 1448/3]